MGHSKIELLKTDYSTRTILHQNNLIAGFLRNVFLARISKPDCERVPYFVIERPVAKRPEATNACTKMFLSPPVRSSR